MSEPHATTLPPRDSLLEFRSRHRPKMFGLDWSYYSLGGGAETILLLAGGIGGGESYFEYMTALEDSFRVLAPNVPGAAGTISEAVSGIVDILDTERIAGVHVFGHSHGGYVAQALVRMFPDRVRSLMLSNTCIPDAELAPGYRRQARLLRFVPGPAIGLAMRPQVSRLLLTDAAELAGGEREFWLGYLREQFSGPGLRDLALGSARLQFDYHARLAFAPDDLEGWPGPVLIFESEGDTLVMPEQRKDLRAIYPGARAKTFAGAGHLAIITRTAEYIQAIREFVTEATR